jgi:hypothetical protein
MVDKAHKSHSDESDDGRTSSLIPKNEVGLIRKGRSTELVRSAFVVDLRPLRQPTLSADFERMSILERTLHAMEYQARVLEFRLGPNGWIRAWMLASLRILLFVIVPVAAFLIGLAFLVPAAAGVSSFFAATEAATQHAFWTVVYGILTMITFALGTGLIATLIRVARRR